MSSIFGNPRRIITGIVAAVVLFYVLYAVLLMRIKVGRSYYSAPLAAAREYRLLGAQDASDGGSGCRSGYSGGTLSFAANGDWRLQDTLVMCTDAKPMRAIAMDRGHYRMEGRTYV